MWVRPTDMATPLRSDGYSRFCAQNSEILPRPTRTDRVSHPTRYFTPWNRSRAREISRAAPFFCVAFLFWLCVAQMPDPLMDVILASYPSHLPVLVRNLRSWNRHVEDVHRVTFDVIVRQVDRPMFALLLHGKDACGLAKLSIKLFTFEHLMRKHLTLIHI